MGVAGPDEGQGLYFASRYGVSFFLREGLSPDSVDAVRRCIVNLSLRTRTGMDYLFGLPLSELLKILQAMKK